MLGNQYTLHSLGEALCISLYVGDTYMERRPEQSFVLLDEIVGLHAPVQVEAVPIPALYLTCNHWLRRGSCFEEKPMMTRLFIQFLWPRNEKRFSVFQEGG